MKTTLLIIFLFSSFWIKAQDSQLTFFYDNSRRCYVLTSDIRITKIKLAKKKGNSFEEKKDIIVGEKFFRLEKKLIKDVDRMTVIIGGFATLIDLKKLI